MPDEHLTCLDCKQDFIFTDGEAAFYAARGLIAPKRCKDCRAKRKLDRNAAMSHVRNSAS